MKKLPDRPRPAMRQLRIGVLINANPHGSPPTARRGRRLFEGLGTLESRYRLQVFKAVTASPEEVSRYLKWFKEQRIKVLAIGGGDGTIHTVLNEAARLWPDRRMPALLLLRTGTMNLLAKEVGYRGSGLAVMARVFRRISRQNRVLSTRRVALDVNGRLSFAYGCGLPMRFLRLHHLAGGNRLAALSLAWRYLFRLIFKKRGQSLFNGLPVEVAESVPLVDEQHRRNRRPGMMRPRFHELASSKYDLFNLLLVQTIRPFFWLLKPVYFVADLAGGFGLIWGRMTFKTYLVYFAAILFHLPVRNSDYRRHIGRRLLLRFHRPTAYYLDGEFYRSSEHDIKSGPVLHFIRSW